MVLNSYDPSQPLYTSPEWTVAIEILVQSHLQPRRRFALFSNTNN